MSASPILLLGAGGMLGSAFLTAFGDRPVLRLPRDVLDVTKPRALIDAIVTMAPGIIINCAADTNVEKAESDPASSFAVNAMLPALLGQAAHEAGSLLVHFSSTGCYGRKPDGDLAPHSDFAPLNPTTVHHRSKVAGEMAVREAGCAHLILRLGWLYGGSIHQPKNFVWARIREARGKSELASDPHQLGSPTFVGDVVKQTLLLLDQRITGTFNCVATGSVSRYDYVARILALAGLSPRLLPVRFQRVAPVSPIEAAVNDKLQLLGLDVMPNWDEALAGYVRSLLSEENDHA